MEVEFDKAEHRYHLHNAVREVNELPWADCFDGEGEANAKTMGDIQETLKSLGIETGPDHNRRLAVEEAKKAGGVLASQKKGNRWVFWLRPTDGINFAGGN